VNGTTGLDIDVVPAAGVAGAAAHKDAAHVSLANFFAKKVGRTRTLTPHMSSSWHMAKAKALKTPRTALSSLPVV
jgi:hypothetical protein